MERLNFSVKTLQVFVTFKCELMATIKLSAAVAGGITGKQCQRRGIKKAILVRTYKGNSHNCILRESCGKQIKFNNAVKNCGLISDQHVSDFQLSTSGSEERFAVTREKLINGTTEGVM